MPGPRRCKCAEQPGGAPELRQYFAASGGKRLQYWADWAMRCLGCNLPRYRPPVSAGMPIAQLRHNSLRGGHTPCQAGVYAPPNDYAHLRFYAKAWHGVVCPVPSAWHGACRVQGVGQGGGARRVPTGLVWELPWASVARPPAPAQQLYSNPHHRTSTAPAPAALLYSNPHHPTSETRWRLAPAYRAGRVGHAVTTNAPGNVARHAGWAGHLVPYTGTAGLFPHAGTRGLGFLGSC